MAPATEAAHRRRRIAIGAGVVVAVALGVAGTIHLRGAAGDRSAPGAGGVSDEPWGVRAEGPTAGPELGEHPAPSAGWEEAAEVIVADLRRLLDGHASAGAFAEALAEASRQDLARHPPERGRLRRMLLGGERERTLALAALSAHPVLDDGLVGIVLRSQRPEDDAEVRLLGAEIASALPADLLSRHEEELLRAFEGEENPLVLAVALPALERMDDARLRALLRTQLESASPAMLRVLVGLARDRLGPEALTEVGILVHDAGDVH